MESIKQYVSLAALLLIATAIYFVEPGGLLAAILVQALALAIIGAGGKKLSKVAVSMVVLAVSGAVAYFQVDGAFPNFPAYAGDVALYAQAIFAFAQDFITYAAPIVGAAMLTYNLILENVLKLIGGQVGLRLEPK